MRARDSTAVGERIAGHAAAAAKRAKAAKKAAASTSNALPHAKRPRNASFLHWEDAAAAAFGADVAPHQPYPTLMCRSIHKPFRPAGLVYFSVLC